MIKIRFAVVLTLLLAVGVCSAKEKVVRLSVVPKEASIYVNGVFFGQGETEFIRPRGKDVTVIKIECQDYNTVITKFYPSDKRSAISYALQQDGLYRATVESDMVNRFLTISVDYQYYEDRGGGKVDMNKAWKLLHQILLNYFSDIVTADYNGGFVQTGWKYKQFNLSEKQMRNRVIVKDISENGRAVFQLKVESELASGLSVDDADFEPTNRIPQELESVIRDLQTRIGKVTVQ